MLLCLKSLRDGECFCSRYDENRQTMFYCGFFTTIAGFIWFLIGFTIRCSFFAEAFGPSVDAVACGIMVVGLMILIIGICCTISIVCSSKTPNKTSCISSSSSSAVSSATTSTSNFSDADLNDDIIRRKIHSKHHHHHHRNNKSKNLKPFDGSIMTGTTTESSELFNNSNSYQIISQSLSSSRPSTQQSNSYRSDIAMIA